MLTCTGNREECWRCIIFSFFSFSILFSEENAVRLANLEITTPFLDNNCEVSSPLLDCLVTHHGNNDVIDSTMAIIALLAALGWFAPVLVKSLCFAEDSSQTVPAQYEDCMGACSV